MPWKVELVYRELKLYFLRPLMGKKCLPPSLFIVFGHKHFTCVQRILVRQTLQHLFEYENKIYMKIE
jgi:hypothetical protein